MSVLKKGEMSNSQKQAVITLIEKKGKDRAFLENWRSISLVDYRLHDSSKIPIKSHRLISVG